MYMAGGLANFQQHLSTLNRHYWNLLRLLQSIAYCRLIRWQIDIVTYQLLFFLSDTSLCLFGDELQIISALELSYVDGSSH